METKTLLIVLFILFIASPLSFAIARLIVNTFCHYPIIKHSPEDDVLHDNGIICVCGHPLGEHDWNGCSVMTVESKPNDFSRVICCPCTLTPRNIIEGASNGKK